MPRFLKALAYTELFLLIALSRSSACLSFVSAEASLALESEDSSIEPGLTVVYEACLDFETRTAEEAIETLLDYTLDSEGCMSCFFAPTLKLLPGCSRFKAIDRI